MSTSDLQYRAFQCDYLRCARTTLLEILAGQDNIRDRLQGIRLGLEADRAERRKIMISWSCPPSSGGVSTKEPTLGEERQKMLRILGDVDARKWQDSNIRLRQPGTGIWFTDGADFKSWLSTDESKLWVNGIRKFSGTSMR